MCSSDLDGFGISLWPVPALTSCTSLCAGLLQPQQTSPLGGQTPQLLFPPSFPAFLRPEPLCLPPILQGSAHTHLRCGVTFSDAPTALTILTHDAHSRELDQSAVFVRHLTVSCRNHRLCAIYPQPLQHPTRELPFEIQCFPSAKILNPDFLP